MTELKKSTASAGGKCPICGVATTFDSRPFCSKRCKDIDLSRWLNGTYAIAGGNTDADEDGDPALEAPSQEKP